MAEKITLLGTGTSCGIPTPGCHCPVCTSTDPRDKRLRCSALVQTQTTNILIDCGPDFREQMLRLDWDKPFDGVLITHEHYDHVGGIDDLRPYTYSRDVTPMYADPFCARHLRERLPYCLVRNTYPGVPKITLTDINPREKLQIGDVTVTPVRVYHDKLRILGYRLNDIGYITDMTSMDEIDLRELDGIKLLIINALRHYPHHSHQTVEQACQVARRFNCETYLIHMSHQMGRHADEEPKLPEHIHLGYDGLEITVHNS